MSTVPSRSVPPPQVPAELVAEARIRILQEERAVTQDETLGALLCYELGAQLERLGRDPTKALEKYRAAYRMAPMLVSPLLALHRIHAGQPDYTRQERVLDALHHAAPTASGRAAFLTEHALLLLDQLGQTERGETLLETALEADAQCQAAALMLEHHHASQGQLNEAHQAIEKRARQITDPALRGALLLELAEHYLTRGDPQAAEQVWLEASTLGHGRYAALERLYYHATLHDNLPRALGILEEQTRLAAAFARGDSQAVEDDNAPLGRFIEPLAAAVECGVLYREVAQLRRERASDGGGLATLDAFKQALQYHDDPLLWHEAARAARQAHAHQEVARAAREMWSRARSAEEQALWRFYEGEAAAYQHRADLALGMFREANTLAPQRPAILAALERQLWDNGELSQLCRHLQLQADQDEDDRERLLLQAAHIAARLLGDERLAQSLCSRIDLKSPMHLAGQRLLLAEGQVRGWSSTFQQTLTSLLAHSPDERECGYLLRLRYHALRDSGSAEHRQTRLRKYLAETLPLGPGADWVPHAARVVAAQQQDWGLLAQAHIRLAETRSAAEARSAHLCAAARAQNRDANPAAAEAALREALGLHPENHYALALLKRTLAHRGDSEAMTQLLYENALHQGDLRRALCHLLDAGLATEQQGNLVDASAHYRAAIARDTGHPAPAWALWFCAQQSCDLQDQEAALLHLQQSGAFSGAALDLAELYDRQGRHEEADQQAERALEMAGEQGLRAALRLWIFGTRPEVRSSGQRYLRKEQPAGPWTQQASLLCTVEPVPALETQASPQGAAPKDPFQQTLAALDLLLGRDSQAEGDTAGPAPTASPVLAGAYQTLAQHCETPQHHAALTLQSLRYEQLAPADAGVTSEKDAGIARALGLRAAAPNALETAIALEEWIGPGEDPKLRLGALAARQQQAGTEAVAQNPGTRLALAQTLLSCGEYDDALRQAYTVIEDSKHGLTALEVVREAAYQLGAHTQLVEANERLAQACPPATAAALLLEAAHCLIDHLGNLDDAERVLLQSLALVPADPEAFGRLHDLRVDRGDLAGLLALLRAFLAEEIPTPLRVELLLEAAQLCCLEGQMEQALADLQTLLDLQPAFVPALRLQSEVHQAVGDPQAAVHSLDQLASQEIGDDERRSARLQAAELLLAQLRQPLEAVTQLRKLEQEGLANEEVLTKLAELSHGAGLHGDAVAAFRRAATLGTGPSRAKFLRRAGTVLELALGDAPGATAAYREALHANPTDRDAHAALQHLLPTTEERKQEAGRFMGQVLVRLTAQPLAPNLLQGLRSAAKYAGLPFAEYAALDALYALGVSTSEERNARKALLELGVHRPKLPLEETGLRVLRKERDSGIGLELARGCTQALEKLANLRPESYGVGRRDRLKKGPLVTHIAQQLALFGVRLRTLYVGGENRDGLQLIPTRTAGLTDCLVGAGATEANSLNDEQRFVLGRGAMALRQGTFALFELSSDTRRHALLATAQAAELPITRQAAPPLVAELSVKINRYLPRRARKRIEAVASPLTQLWPGLENYTRAAELSMLRSGLFCCGRLDITLREALEGRDRRMDQPLPPPSSPATSAPHTHPSSLAPGQDPNTATDTRDGRSSLPPASTMSEVIAASETGLDLLRFWTSTRSLALHGEQRPKRQAPERSS